MKKFIISLLVAIVIFACGYILGDLYGTSPLYLGKDSSSQTNCYDINGNKLSSDATRKDITELTEEDIAKFGSNPVVILSGTAESANEEEIITNNPNISEEAINPPELTKEELEALAKFGSQPAVLPSN